MGLHVLEAAAAHLADQGITQIALFGSGQHTRPIVRQPWVRFGISVRLIIDDQPTIKAMGGVPIVQTQEAEIPSEVGAIVISSQHYEQQLYERACQAFGSLGVPIIRLYTKHGSPYEDEPTRQRLRQNHGLSAQDADWLVKNRTERHDALLPMLPPERTELHLRRYELASELIEKIEAQSVADLACGTGYGATILQGQAPLQGPASLQGHAPINYIGVDIDPQAIAYATRRYGSQARQYCCASATAIPIEDNAVDLIASFETIEHIEETHGLCAQYARVLKPQGRLVVSTPNKLGPTPFHVHDFDLESFVQALSSHFEIIELIAQLPTDEVFDPRLPPGMWTLDPSQVDHLAIGPDRRRPDFLIAIAKHQEPRS